MQPVTFLGEVQGGRILTDQPLAAFEGRQVVITLSAPGAETSPVKGARSPALPHAPEEAEVLEDAGRVRAPRREVTAVRLGVVDVGRRPMRAYPSDEES